MPGRWFAGHEFASDDAHPVRLSSPHTAYTDWCFSETRLWLSRLFVCCQCTSGCDGDGDFEVDVNVDVGFVLVSIRNHNRVSN